MADISLGTLRDYWKAVSDWVQGNSADKPEIAGYDSTDDAMKTKQIGRNVPLNEVNSITVPAGDSYTILGDSVNEDYTEIVYGFDWVNAPSSWGLTIFYKNSDLNGAYSSDDIVNGSASRRVNGKHDFNMPYFAIAVYNNDSSDRDINYASIVGVK